MMRRCWGPCARVWASVCRDRAQARRAEGNVRGRTAACAVKQGRATRPAGKASGSPLRSPRSAPQQPSRKWGTVGAPGPPPAPPHPFSAGAPRSPADARPWDRTSPPRPLSPVPGGRVRLPTLLCVTRAFRSWCPLIIQKPILGAPRSPGVRGWLPQVQAASVCRPSSLSWKRKRTVPSGRPPLPPHTGPHALGAGLAAAVCPLGLLCVTRARVSPASLRRAPHCAACHPAGCFLSALSAFRHPLGRV